MEEKTICTADHVAEKLPVTSLCFVTLDEQELLLSGQGCRLKVYEPQGKQLLSSEQVLPVSCRIYGLRWREHAQQPKEVLVLVFGQKKMKIVTIRRSTEGIRVMPITELQEFSDWILEACFMNDAMTTVAMVMAHNKVILWDRNKSSQLSSAECETQCILYSARLSHHSDRGLIVASGTVFNQVLLWQHDGLRDLHTDRVKVNISLTGHDGVIFSIRFSRDNQRICSVSDDRTVRVWTLPQGWGRVYSKTLDHADMILYGHLARVWDGHILDNCIISSSEDVTCRVWNYNGDCLQVIEGHKGRNIWSMAVNCDETLLATGGGDCAILLTNLHKQIGPTSMLFKLKLNESEKCEDFVRAVRLLCTNVVICLTNEGRLYCVTVDSTSKVYKWSLLSEDPRFAGYSVISISPCRQMVALGNLKGEIKVAMLCRGEAVAMRNEVIVAAHHGKIFSLVFLELDGDNVSMVTTGPEGCTIWWKVDSSNDYRVLPTLKKYAELVLPPCKHRWVTAATVCPLHKGKDCVLVCGDRKGSVHSYLVRQEGIEWSKEALDPVSSLFGLHGQHGVSSLRCPGNRLVYSTGREGHIRHYEVKENGALLEIAGVKVFKGFDWIERLLFVSNQEYVIGFHSTEFLIYNLTKGQIVACVQCGGGHRTWDFDFDVQNTGRQGLVYLKGSEIHFHQIELDLEPQQTIVEESFHGREVNCLLQLHSPEKYSAYFVTGSEDCSVRIVKHNFHTNHLSQTACYESHISSVRALTSSASVHNGKLLLFSGGGRARLKAWEVKRERISPYSQPALTSLGEISLGIFSDRKRRKLQKSPHLPPPPSDCRVMGLTAFPLSLMTGSYSSHGLHCVIGACSDAFVRIYVFDDIRRKFHPIERTLQHKNCLFCIRSVIVTPSNPEVNPVEQVGPQCVPSANLTKRHAYILVGGASGETAIWDITGVLQEWIENHLGQLKGEESSKVKGQLVKYGDKPIISGIEISHLDADVKDSHIDGNTKESHLDGNVKDPPFECGPKDSHLDSDVKVSHLDGDVKVSHLDGSVKDSHLDGSVKDSHLDGDLKDGHLDGDVKDSHLDGSVKDSHLDGDVKDGHLDGDVKDGHLDANTKERIKSDHSDISEEQDGHPSIQHLSSIPSHQSGVNAIDFTCFDTQRNLYLVASGGDDTALCVALVKLQPQSVAIVNKKTRPSAHYAAITGVVCKDVTTVITASVDQRVTLWGVNVTMETMGGDPQIEILHVRTVLTDVADVSCLSLYPASQSREQDNIRVVVSGMGLQCLDV